MTSGSNHEEFALELLNAIRRGTFVRNPNVSDRINNFAENVKRKFDELTSILDERGIQNFTGAIDLAESLKSRLKGAMANRRRARASGIVGTIMRLGGTLSYLTPVGQIVFWGGFAMSSFSDIIAEISRKDIDELSPQIRAILDRDRESFRAVVTAIRNLDEAIQSETGWSLYDEEFQEFLRNAAETPERAHNLVPCTVDNPEHRKNLIQIARNHNLLMTLKKVIEGFRRQDMLLLSAVSQFMFAISFIKCSPEAGAAIQVGELTVRGLNLYIEYKRDRLTLKEFERGIARMRKELEALKKLYPDL